MLNMQGMGEVVPRLSNKQRQARGKRKAQGKQLASRVTKQSKGMTGLRIQLDKAKNVVGRGAKISVGVKVANTSRIYRSPSDIIRPNMLPPEQDVRYGLDYWIEEQARRLPHNSNRLVPNRSSVRVREYSEKLGRVITKTVRVDHGGFYRKPTPKPQMLGPPSLADDCIQLTDRDWMVSSMARTDMWVEDQVSGVRYIKSVLMPVGHKLKYHQPIGTLPAWKDHRPTDYAKLARDMAVAEWKAEKVRIVQEWCAYLQHLGVEMQ